MKSQVIRFLSEPHERAITIFGVMFLALGMFNPTGIITVMVREYGLSADYWGASIIIGMFLKGAAPANLWLRLLGALPYTVFTALAFNLWLNGSSTLLQSQIMYVVLWLLLIQPLLRDFVTRYTRVTHAG